MSTSPTKDELSTRHTVATVSSTWSGNSIYVGGYLRSVRCRPGTSTTRYDIRLVDRDDQVIYHRKGIQGAICDNLFGIPCRSILTVYIENATADETFEDLSLYWEP